MIVRSITSHTAPQGRAEASILNLQVLTRVTTAYLFMVDIRQQLQTSEVPRPALFFRASQDLSEIEL